MENQVAIEVKNVTKSFKVYYDKGRETDTKTVLFSMMLASLSKEVKLSV